MQCMQLVGCIGLIVFTHARSAKMRPLGGLLLQMKRGVCVCLSDTTLCLHKWMTRSRCRLGCGLMWAPGNR